jgi:hypothetical protein
MAGAEDEEVSSEGWLTVTDAWVEQPFASVTV